MTAPTLLQASIVVVATNHNPSILHPSFLEAQRIIPRGWELAEPAIATPPLAVARYTNGVTFQADEARFQLLADRFSDETFNTDIPEYAHRYIQALPHVKYTGVGLNYTVIFPMSDAPGYTVEQFIDDGPWLQAPSAPQAAGIRLIYELEACRLQITIESGQARPSQNEADVEGLIIAANYHHQAANIQEVLEAVSRFDESATNFLSLTRTWFEERAGALEL